MSKLICQHCGATTTGAVLCKRCMATAEVSLAAIAENHAAIFSLGSTPPRVRRRGELSDPTGNRVATAETPDQVETAAAETTTMLVGWTRALLDDRPALRAPADSVAAMTAFLGKNLRTIAVLEWAGALVNDLLRYERRLTRLVSSGQGHWYAGICLAVTGSGPDDWCPQDLFVRPGDTLIRCRACGSGWSVDQRRRQLIEQAREELLPVALIARVAVSFLDDQPSQQRLEARLRKWVERGVIDDYGVRVVAGIPRRVYRLGDVLDRLAREAAELSA